jgi:membrane associated rhomboid family serine protease
VFYLLTRIGAGLFYALLNRNSTVPLVVVSGAISGILAAYVLLPLRQGLRLHAPVCRAHARLLGDGCCCSSVRSPAKPMTALPMWHTGGADRGRSPIFAMKPAGLRLFECIEQPGEDAASA